MSAGSIEDRSTVQSSRSVKVEYRPAVHMVSVLIVVDGRLTKSSRFRIGETTLDLCAGLEHFGSTSVSIIPVI